MTLALAILLLVSCGGRGTVCPPPKSSLQSDSGPRPARACEARR